MQIKLLSLWSKARQWNQEFCSKLVLFGFRRSAYDHYLFIKQNSESFLAFLIYVDDVIITGSLEADIVLVKQFLDYVFIINDLGYAKYFLGLEITRNTEGMYIHKKNVLDIVRDVGLLYAKPATTPMSKGHKFSPTSSLLSDSDHYRHLVGRLLYVTMTPPNVTYVVQQLSQHITAPQEDHWIAALYFTLMSKAISIHRPVSFQQQ